MLNIVLVEPEIPQNTGNIARTCACTGSKLHLIEPMGFRLTERNLKRAGCDYWDDVEIVHWPSLAAYLEANADAAKYLFTGQAKAHHSGITYPADVHLLFGRESAGLPQELIDANKDACVRIPMVEGQRSLNLSNSVAIALYEALRQLGYPNCV